MNIRSATETDEDRLWEMAQVAHKETRYARHPLDRTILRAYLYSGIADPDNFVTLVTEQDDKITGFLMAYIRTYWFGSGRASYDMMIYVDPEHRGTSAAPRLVKAYVEWAQARGVDNEDIWIGTTTGIREHDVGRFFERMGFSRVGGLYTYK